MCVDDLSRLFSHNKPSRNINYIMASINKLNILNTVFYIINTVVTYGVGSLGWLGNATNSELSDKYQTLVTPNSSAFLIWAVIFTFQGIFAIIQLIPPFQGKTMVLEGVKYYYIMTCIFQAAWTLAFAYEVIWLSLVFMLSIWASLVALLYSQYYTKSEGTLLEFWLLRFPFAIHCGWLTAASAVNVNVVVVDIDPPADIQLAVGIISLAVLHAISVWVTFGFKRPNYTIAGVLAWANYWIYKELQEPRDQIVALFSMDLISGVSYAGVAVAAIILLQVVIHVPFDVYARCCKKTEETRERTPEKGGSDGS
jgi:benzodiazapine receptor